MNKGLEPSPSPAHQADRGNHAPTRLSECGDTVGIAEVCGVLGISARELHRLRQHGVFPEPLVCKRWSKAVVQRFIDGTSVSRGPERHAGRG